MPFTTYNTADDIPSSKIKQNSKIYGKVGKVIDGDTLRIRHLPLYPFVKSNDYKGSHTEHTISIRIYGVDAPETAKKGNPGMPFANEATEYTKDLLDQKIVSIKLLRKDQYNRIVGVVKTASFIPFCGSNTDVSMGLAKGGLATLYTGGGAEYNGNREGLEKNIEYAKKKKKGIWSSDNVALPSDYKRNHK